MYPKRGGSPSSPVPPGHRFGPTGLIAPTPVFVSAMQGHMRFRQQVRDEIGAAWWAVASYATEDARVRTLFRMMNTGASLRDQGAMNAFVDRMVVLREHVTAVGLGQGSEANLEAVANSGDVWPRATRPYPVWLAGAILDGQGVGTVGILNDENLRTLWQHILEAKRADKDANRTADQAVHLLGCWLQDVVQMYQQSFGMTIQYMGEGPPLVQEDQDTRRLERRVLVEIVNRAFGLLAEWGLHLQRRADGTPRRMESSNDPEYRALFRIADQQVSIDSRTDLNPLTRPGPPPA